MKLLGLGTAVFRPQGAEAATAGPGENARFQAPEVAAGAVAADSRADLYSLAVTACHALGATIGFGDSPVVQLPLSVSFDLENDEALRQGLERALRQLPRSARRSASCARPCGWPSGLPLSGRGGRPPVAVP